MNYRVVYTRTVTNALDEQIAYFLDQHVSPSKIVDWLTGLYDGIDALYHSPKRYPVADRQSAAMGFTVRKFIYGRYLVYYRVDEAERLVEVLRFTHAARVD